jgi:hypothetical protein
MEEILLKEDWKNRTHSNVIKKRNRNANNFLLLRLRIFGFGMTGNLSSGCKVVPPKGFPEESLLRKHTLRFPEESQLRKHMMQNELITGFGRYVNRRTSPI